MKKNILKLGVIGLALVFTMGLSLNAMAADTKTKGKTTKAKTAITQQGKRVEPTAAEIAKMKASAAANYKKILDYFVGTGAITQTDADTAYKLISESTERLDMSKLPASVQKALNDLRDTQKNLTETQKTALRTTVDEFFKVEVQKLVDSKVITSDIATQLLSTTKGDKTEKATLTVTQMDAIRTAHQQAGKAAIDKLKTAGTITSEQAAKLGLEGMGIGGPMGHNGHGGPDGSGNKDGMSGRGHGGSGHNNNNQLGTNSNK